MENKNNFKLFNLESEKLIKERKEARLEKLLKEIEDIRGNSIFDVDKLKELVKNQDYKEDWHCSGRMTEKEGRDIRYCIYAYSINNSLSLGNHIFRTFKDNDELIFKCQEDCRFYRDLHEKWYKKLYKKLVNHQ